VALPRTFSQDHRLALLIFTLVFVSYAYFYGGGGWNQDSRMDLVRAIVEEHTLHIDDYQQNTGDKGFVNGHYYSDKAPGLALFATPFVELGSLALRSVGLDPRSTHGVLVLSYIANLFAIVIPSAIGAAVLFLVCRKLHSSSLGGAFAAIAMALATPVWAYSTVFFGHVLAGTCLLGAFALTLKMPDEQSNHVAFAVAIGLLAGWATVTEYPAAPASSLIALLAVSQVWHRGASQRWRVAFGIAAGAFVNILVLAWYQHAAFGSFFSLAYSHYQPGAFPEMNVGFHGLTSPSPSIAVRLLVAPHLGLLWFAPVLLFAPVGLVALARPRHTRAYAIAATCIALYYWLFNASFASGWDGGWAYGPRYMVPALPFACIGLAPVWDLSRKYLRPAMLIGAGYGYLCTLMAVSTTVMLPERYRWPLYELYWPLFWSGKLALNSESFFIPAKAVDPHHAAFNLGQVLGLRGLATLTPLIAVWVVLSILWFRTNRSAKGARKPPESVTDPGTRLRNAVSS
jgi:hypothetical protein